MGFVLSHQLVGSPDAEKLAFVLHGVFGAGHNFRSFVRKLAERRPEYRYCLVDLRHHGGSQGAPPPDTLASAARDLDQLSVKLGDLPHVLIGHSFGGKVALAHASTQPREQAPAQVWILDATPGPTRPGPDHEVVRVLAALRNSPTVVESREVAVEALEKRGIARPIARWLSTNLKRAGDSYRWNLDLDAIENLLEDYFRADLWPALESATAPPEYRLVVASESDRWSPDTRERVAQLKSPAVKQHLVPNSGHWVHVDNPAFLLELLAKELA